MYLVVFFIFLTGIVVYGNWRKHLLISLLSLEYIVLGIFLLFHYSIQGYYLILRMGYLTFTACEGALGLTILVIMSRTHGGDYLKIFHMY